MSMLADPFSTPSPFANDETADKVIGALAGALFNALVGLPVDPSIGRGIVCPVNGGLVDFATAVERTTIDDVAGGIQKLAQLIKATGQAVGAVKLHVLTQCTALPLADDGSKVLKVDVFWDGLFELADGSLYSPKPSTTAGFYEDGDTVSPASD